MVITHNISALNTGRQLGVVQRRAEDSSFKLASGYRINKAADDAAGLSVSETMREQIRGLDRASLNSTDGISLIQTAEGAMGEIHSILQRMGELSVQAANDTNTDDDRQTIQEEIELLKAEIDRIAEDTEFNTIKLLDGTFSDPGTTSNNISVSALNGVNKGQSFTMQELNSQKGMKIVYEDVTYGVNTVQTPIGPATTPGYAPLKTALKNQIVPQAVQAIVNKYSTTFGYLHNSSIGIGLALENKSGSQVLASVTMGTSSTAAGVNVMYKLTVNMASLKFDNVTGNLDPTSRDELEVTIIHEMTHAMMDEALTNGMLGHGGDPFPMWFIEGMAQASAGGCFDGNDWVNGGLGITASTPTAQIANILNSKASGPNGVNHLSAADSGSGIAQYGTGYLACMYLGYLASGSGSVNASKIASGLDKIMNEIKSGTSMQDAVKKYTKYQTLSDFENNFGNDAAGFVHNLVTAVGSGSGGLVSGLTTSKGFLPDKNLNVSLFELNTASEGVTNAYPSDHPVYAGGTKLGTGPAGPKGGGGTLNIQIGANANQLMAIYIDSMSTGVLGVLGVNVTSFQDAQDAIESVHMAIDIVSHQRAKLGAYENRLNYAISNLDNSSENLQAAESKIRDLDMAEEMVQFSASQILLQSGQSMLAQANQNSNGILSLLR